MRIWKQCYFLLVLLFSCQSVFGQFGFSSQVQLLTEDHDTVFVQSLNLRGPLVLEFWNMGCGPCISFLNQVAERYDEWKDSTQTQIIAIVSPGIDPITPRFVAHKKWPFPVYYDIDFAFYKALSSMYSGEATIEGFPTAYVLNNENQLVYKLTNVKRKSSREPKPGEELTKEMLELDFAYYYQLSKRWK